MMAKGLSKMRDKMSPGRMPPPGQTQDGVELPARLMDFDRQLFDLVVILVVRDVEVFTVFGQHGLAFKKSLNGFRASKKGVFS